MDTVFNAANSGSKNAHKPWRLLGKFITLVVTCRSEFRSRKIHTLCSLEMGKLMGKSLVCLMIDRLTIASFACKQK